MGSRLALASHLFDIVLVLSQRPGGARLAEISAVLDLAPSSVQSGLRTLTVNGLVVRGARATYSLAPHPAIDALVAFAARRADPGEATLVVLRSNEGVVFACRDEGGFVVAERMADDRSRAALDRVLGTIAADRSDAPPVLRFADDQLRRLLRSALGLRARVGQATVVKAAGTARPRPRRDELAAVVPSRSA